MKKFFVSILLIILVSIGSYSSYTRSYTGQKIWSYVTDFYIKHVEITVAGSDDGNIYAIDGKNGSTIWTVNVEGEIKEIEIAQMDEYDVLDIVVAVSWPANKVVVINGSNGNLVWEYDNVDYVSHIEVFDVNNDAFNDIAIATPKMGSQAGELIMVDGLSHNAVCYLATISIIFSWNIPSRI